MFLDDFYFDRKVSFQTFNKLSWMKVKQEISLEKIYDVVIS